jgi:hypothetical protein
VPLIDEDTGIFVSNLVIGAAIGTSDGWAGAGSAAVDVLVLDTKASIGAGASVDAGGDVSVKAIDDTEIIDVGRPGLSKGKAVGISPMSRGSSHTEASIAASTVDGTHARDRRRERGRQPTARKICSRSITIGIAAETHGGPRLPARSTPTRAPRGAIRRLRRPGNVHRRDGQRRDLGRQHTADDAAAGSAAVPSRTAATAPSVVVVVDPREREREREREDQRNRCAAALAPPAETISRHGAAHDRGRQGWTGPRSRT